VRTVRWRASKFHFAVAISVGAAVALGACGSEAAQSVPDEVLKARVEAALQSASDVPADAISVEVSNGVVTLTGSVACEGCGGSLTPSGFGAVQQSVGAVVRAIPGIGRVEFELEYEPPAGGSGGAGG
jgi:hypothetical protein